MLGRRPATRGSRTVAAALGLLVAAAACSGPRSRVDLDQPIPGLTSGPRPLQVVLHELVEVAPRGAAVRVCRSLASESVSADGMNGQPLGALLEGLAAQAGTDLAPAGRSARGGEALPTLRCPSGSGDYLVIGRPPG